MTDDAATGPAPRRATIRSDVAAPETVAVAIAPDDTDQIDTRVEDGAVVSTVERPTTASLEATVDDYVVALDVATSIVRSVDRRTDAHRGDSDRTDVYRTHPNRTDTSRTDPNRTDRADDGAAGNRHADTQ